MGGDDVSEVEQRGASNLIGQDGVEKRVDSMEAHCSQITT
jgi:hypothetical protein